MKLDVLGDAREVMQSRQLNSVQLAKKRYAMQLDPLCRSYGLTKTELDVILFLHNNPGLDRAVDIVNVRQIAKSHVSLSVTNLEERGFLYRVYDPADRRTAHLKLTDQALPVAEEGKRLQQVFFNRIFAGLTQEELALWRSILEKVSSNILSMEE